MVSTTLALQQGEHQQRSQSATVNNENDDNKDPVDLVDSPNVDPGRVDVLGWTDAHHAACGSAITTSAEGVGIIIPQEESRAFLEQSTFSSKLLCQSNDFGQIPLHLAVRQNNLDVVSLYIDWRINCIDEGNRDGDTPLHYAAAWGRSRAAEILLEGGADPKIKNKSGQTPMDDAISYDHKDIWSLMKSFIETYPEDNCPQIEKEL